MQRNNGKNTPAVAAGLHVSSPSHSPPSPQRTAPQDPVTQHISPIKKIPRNSSTSTSTASPLPQARSPAGKVLFRDGPSYHSSNMKNSAGGKPPPLPSSGGATMGLPRAPASSLSPSNTATSFYSAPSTAGGRRAPLPPPPPSHISNRLTGSASTPVGATAVSATPSASSPPPQDSHGETSGPPGGLAGLGNATQQRQALPERRRPPPQTTATPSVPTTHTSGSGSHTSSSEWQKPHSPHSGALSSASPFGQTSPPPPPSSSPSLKSVLSATPSSTFFLAPSSSSSASPNGQAGDDQEQERFGGDRDTKGRYVPLAMKQKSSPPPPPTVPSVTLSSSPSTISLSPSSHSSLTPPPASLFAIPSPPGSGAFPARSVEPIERDIEARSTEDANQRNEDAPQIHISPASLPRKETGGASPATSSASSVLGSFDGDWAPGSEAAVLARSAVPPAKATETGQEGRRHAAPGTTPATRSSPTSTSTSYENPVAIAPTIATTTTAAAAAAAAAAPEDIRTPLNRGATTSPLSGPCPSAGLTAASFHKWQHYQRGKSLQSHLHRCAVTLQRERQRETAAVYFIRWLSVVERRVRDAWREEVCGGPTSSSPSWEPSMPVPVEAGSRQQVPYQQHEQQQQRYPSPPPSSSSSRRHVGPWKVTLLPTPQSAIDLAMRYFRQWRRCSRRGAQRRRALVQACGLTAPTREKTDIPVLHSTDTNNNNNTTTSLSSPSTSSSLSTSGAAVTAITPTAYTPAPPIFAPRARAVFHQWMIWAIRRQAEERVTTLRAALAEEQAAREQAEQALERCVAALEEEKAHREREREERLQDLEGLRQEFEALQSAALEEREAERRRGEEAQKRRQRQFSSRSPYHSESDTDYSSSGWSSSSGSDSGGSEGQGDRHSSEDVEVDGDGNTLSSSQRRRRRRRRERRAKLGAGFANSAFKKACEAYRRKQEEALSEARGWLQQLHAKLRAWNTTDSNAAREFDSAGNGSFPPDDHEQETIADPSGVKSFSAKQAARRERRKRRAEAKARERSVIHLSKDAWQEGLRLLHGLQYLQNATEHYYEAPVSEKAVGQDGSDGQLKAADLPPCERLLARLQGMHQDVVSLRSAVENALLLLRPAPAPSTSELHHPRRGHDTPSNGGLPSSTATPRALSTPFSQLPADQLAETLLLHAQQVTYAYELCCDSLALPRTPPTTGLPPREGSPSPSAVDAAAREVAAQLSDIQQAGREFTEARQAKRELVGMLLLSTVKEEEDKKGEVTSCPSPSLLTTRQERVWLDVCTGVQDVVRQHRSAHELLFQLLALLVDPLQQEEEEEEKKKKKSGESSAPQQQQGDEDTHRRRRRRTGKTPAPEKKSETLLGEQVQQWFGVTLRDLRRLLPTWNGSLSSSSPQSGSEGRSANRDTRGKVSRRRQKTSSEAGGREGGATGKSATSSEHTPFYLLLMALQQRVRGELDTMQCTLQQRLRSVLEAVWEEERNHLSASPPSSSWSLKKEDDEEEEEEEEEEEAARRGNGMVGIRRVDSGNATILLGKPPLSKTMRRVVFAVPVTQPAVESSSSSCSSSCSNEESEEIRVLERERKSSLSALFAALVSWRSTRMDGSPPPSLGASQTPLCLLAAAQSGAYYHPSAAMAERLRSGASEECATSHSGSRTLAADKTGGEAISAVFPQSTRVHLLEETLAERQQQLERLRRENQALRAELVEMVADTGEDLTVIQSHLAERYVERETVEAEREAWTALVERERVERQAEMELLHRALDRSVAALEAVVRAIFPLSATTMQAHPPGAGGGREDIQSVEERQSMHILYSAPTVTHWKRLVLAAATWDMEQQAESDNTSPPPSTRGGKKNNAKQKTASPPPLDVCVWEVTSGVMTFLHRVRVELTTLRHEMLDTKDALQHLHRTFFVTPHHPLLTSASRPPGKKNSAGPRSPSASPAAALFIHEVQDFLEQQQQRYLEEQCRLHAEHEQVILRLQHEFDRLEKEKERVEAELKQEKQRQHLWRQKILGMQKQIALDTGTPADFSNTSNKNNGLEEEEEKEEVPGLVPRNPNRTSPTRGPKGSRKQRKDQEKLKEEGGEEEGEGETTDTLPLSSAAASSSPPQRQKGKKRVASGTRVAYPKATAIEEEDQENGAVPHLSAAEASQLLSDSLRQLEGHNVLKVYAHTVEEVLNVYRTTQQSLFYVVHAYHHKFLPGYESLLSNGQTTTPVTTTAALTSPSFLPWTESFIKTVVEQMDILEHMDHSVRMLWSKHLPQLLRPGV